MVSILTAGILLTVVLVGVPKFPLFSLKSIMTDAIATGVSFIALYYVNLAMPIELGLSPLGATAFAMLSAVAEEWFFRLFLCCWAYKITKSMLISVGSSSIIWALFHIARYGGNMSMIWLVFMAGLPLGFFTLYFRSADGPTFGHVIVNFLASR